MAKSIRILLAEDQPIVRQGVRVMLTAVPNCVVVGETGDGAEVVELVERLTPDVVMLDISLPNRSGLEILAQLTEMKACSRVMIFSVHSEEDYVRRALRTGASGYLLKTVELAELHLAILTVLSGHRYLCTPLMDRAIAIYAESGSIAPSPARSQAAIDAQDPYARLTNRQREVLRLVAEGHGNLSIGQILGISPRTVELHRAQVMHKLGLTGQSAVVRYALQRGLISIEG